MLRLDLPTESRWVDLPHGARFLMRPATTPIVTVARLRARRQLEAMRQAAKDAKEAGLPAPGPDLTDPDTVNAYAYALSAVALARELVEDWDGIGDKAGNPVAFAADLLPQLLARPGVAEAVMKGADGADATAAEGNG